MSAEVVKSLQLSYLFMVSSATGLWMCGLPIEYRRQGNTLAVNPVNR
ncbi:hypothetical protein [Chamaesiphon sp. OTE_20_metabat_361]|nr:hypothetical protein [Chamaesiphon sp. OTE_20_metabat_361]